MPFVITRLKMGDSHKNHIKTLFKILLNLQITKETRNNVQQQNNIICLLYFAYVYNYLVLYKRTTTIRRNKRKFAIKTMMNKETETDPSQDGLPISPINQ